MCSQLGFYLIVTVKQAFLLLGPQHTQSQLCSTPTDPALSYCRHQSAGHQANQMSPKPNLALAAEAANPEARNLSPARNPQPSNPARTRGSKVKNVGPPTRPTASRPLDPDTNTPGWGGWTEFCTRSLGLARGGTIGNTSHLSRNAPLSSSPEKNIEVQASDSASILSAEPCGTTKLFISVVNHTTKLTRPPSMMVPTRCPAKQTNKNTAHQTARTRPQPLFFAPRVAEPRTRHVLERCSEKKRGPGLVSLRRGFLESAAHTFPPYT